MLHFHNTKGLLDVHEEASTGLSSCQYRVRAGRRYQLVQSACGVYILGVGHFECKDLKTRWPFILVAAN